MKGLKIQTGSFSCQGDRPSQQDCSGLLTLPQKGTLAIVADGMGGLDHGEELSSLTVSILLRHFEKTPPTEHPPLELCDLCAQGVQAVRERLEGRSEGGTTLAAVLLREGKLSFLTVGDSRVALVRGGSLIWLNRPHSYAAQLAELAAQGEATLAQVLRDPQGAALTSYLGYPEQIRIDVSPEPVTLLRGDRVLVMSDGVFGPLSAKEIVKAVGPAAVRAARRLAQAVKKKGAPRQDNYTAIVISC